MNIRIQVLGQVRVELAGVLSSPASTGQRAVLAVLALAGGQALTRTELVDTLWAGRPPASAVNVIQTYVKHLRRLLEPARPARARSAVLPAIGDGYALLVPRADVDLFRFRALVARAAAERERAAELLGAALLLWRGSPLADVPALSGHPKVLALAQERRLALVRCGEAMMAAGRAADAVRVLQEAVAAEPLDETGQARLIAAFQATGRRAQAFSTFHGVRRLLAEELGVDPGPELIAAHEGLLTPAPPGESRRTEPPAQLPTDVPGFVGRAAHLAELNHRTARVVLITGTAGVGKTALAIRWAHQNRNEFPDGQLYLNLRGYDPGQPVPPTDALARLQRTLGLPGHRIPADLEESAASFRSVIDGRRRLVLLDNAASVEQVRHLLPGSASCLVVVTSRDMLAGLVARHGARRIVLDLLADREAIALLHKLIGKRVAAEPAAAATLVAQCARLPLALRMVAELALARPDAPLAELAGELADHRHRLAVLRLEAVFRWSYRQLPPPAAEVFRLLGRHPGADIDRDAAAALAGVEAPEMDRLLDRLTRAHLVRRDGANRYSMHALLKAYAAGPMPVQPRSSRAAQASGVARGHAPRKRWT